MRKLVLSGLVALAAVFGVAQGAGDISCTGAMTGTVANLVVPNGASCSLSNAQVTGNVQVTLGATLVVVGPSTILGNVEADHCQSVLLTGPVAVGGNVEIHQCTGTSGYAGPGVTIGGNVECHNNSGACLADGGSVGGNLHVHNNTATADISLNTVRGNLQCEGNAATPTHALGPNTVAGQSQGQCALVPPVADAGPDANALVLVSATLDGTGSYDPNGRLIAFRWIPISAPGGSTARLSSASVPKPAFTPDVPGDYVFQLVVNDGLADSAPDSVTLHAFTTDSPPNARPGRDQAVLVGAAVALDGSQSFDPDSDPVTYAWSFVSLPAGSHVANGAVVGANSATPQFVPDVAGTYVLQLAVSDGHLTDKATVHVLAGLPDVAPHADAGPDRTVNSGAPVTLDGSASFDPDNGPSPLTFFWELVSVPAGSALTDASLIHPTTAMPSFTPDVIGPYLFRLTVNDGQKTDADNVLIQVNQNQPPVAVNDSVTTNQNAAVTIAVLANDSDPDGDPLTVIGFTQGGHGTVSFTNNVATYTPNTGFGGTDSFTYTINDGHGATASATVTVRVNSAPVVTAGATSTTITLPASASLTGTATDDGLPNPPGALTITWSQVSGPGTVTFGNAHTLNTTATFSVAGVYVFQLSAFDGQLTTTADVTVTVNLAVGGGGLPPDPRTVAPPVNPTSASLIGKGTEFLYTGPNPIQAGVGPGTIDPVRVAVLRGRVLDRSDAALPGVTITVLNHPEFGQTLSRADGMFDLAVNGGGLLTVNYQKTGLLPAQRQVNAPWQDFAIMPDVILSPLDPRVTAVDLTAGAMRVAQGSPMTDSDGTRTATLLFPVGTTATMVMPNGSAQPLSTLSVRATEYTVGPNGPAAMPAVLPPTSGYTYAVELSADEAIAAGAVTVTFSQPVIQYVENFLGFPVGESVPVGFYDPRQAAWVPAPNGRVVKLLSVTSGFANLDVDGSGVAAGATALAALGITDAERQQLAALYSPGQSLWRVLITHFSPWDANWSLVMPPDATPPQQRLPVTSEQTAIPCQQSHSIIDCDNQVLGEAVPVVGTAMGLHYHSDRVPGRRTAYTLDIPLSGASVPGSLDHIDVDIEVAGRQFTQSFPAAPNEHFPFTWDGQDAYGRLLQGAQPATIHIGYGYRAVYGATPTFGEYGNLPPLRGTRQPFTLEQELHTTLGGWDARGQGLGAWSLTHHHAYDPVARVLYLGSNAQRAADNVGRLIKTVAGTGAQGFTGDGGPATQARLSFPQGVAAAPDGSIYIADAGNNRIRRVGPDGTITTVAGSGAAGFSGDGGPATLARLSIPEGVALGPDGSLYIADLGNERIRRVGPDGIITTVAGTGVFGFGGDGGPATLAMLAFPEGVALGPDGSLYIADLSNNRIRRVGPDRIITTVAGTGASAFGGDGGPATQAALSSPAAVAVGPDGSLYIADQSNDRVRRVGPDGIITTVAGTGVFDFSGDGGPATQAALNFVTGVAVGPDGSLYIADQSNNRIRLVGPDGIITTAAGSGAAGFSGDGGPATQAAMELPFGVAIGPDGSLHLSDEGNNVTRGVTLVFPRFSASDIAIASEDGSELYQFDATGRHLRTLDTLTGAVRFEFAYGGSGRLITVTDGSGNATTVERDSQDNPTAIVAPGGQRTALTLDANGFLSTISNPGGETVQLASTPDGLLTQFTDARGGVHSFTYDALGQLTRDRDPAGAELTFARTDAADAQGYSVTLTTALGRTLTYEVEQQPTGNVRLATVDALGGRTEVVRAPDGSQKAIYPDGITATLALAPDPRFGLEAPVLQTFTRTSPAGRTETITSLRTATLADPNNLFSLQTLTQTVTVNGRTFTATYDAGTRVLTNTSPGGRQTVTTLDALGRVTQESPGTGLAPVQLTYDGQGRVSQVAQGVQSITYSYDAQNRVVSRVDATGAAIQYSYDGADRVRSVTLPSGNPYQLAYDANGNRTQVAMPSGSTHALDYTTTDQLAAYTPPAGNPSSRLYDLDRRLVQLILADGRTVDQSYDSGGRLAALTSPEAVAAFAYAAGDPTQRVSLLTRTPAGGGATQNVAYAYDTDLVTSATWTGVAAGQFTYTYGTDFYLTGITLASGVDVAHLPLVRDPDELIVGYGPFAVNRSGPGALASRIADSVGSADYTYDGFGRWATRELTIAGQLVYGAQFTYDAAGRPATTMENLGGASHTVAYTYDNDGQLTQVTRDGVVTEDYSYDVNGNRIRRQIDGGAPELSTYDAQDRLVQRDGVAYQFDANGFLAQRGGDTFTYGARGELLTASVGVQTVTYAYDALGRRVGRVASGGTTQYLYGNPGQPFQITHVRDSGGTLATLYYDDGGRLFALDRGGSRFYVVTDPIGTPRVVVDATGAIVKIVQYDSFGVLAADSNPAFDLPIGFAGGLADPATGLVGFGFRDYDPTTGRWTARDPILFGGRQANLYAYVRNNPVTFRDPLGLFCLGFSAYAGVGAGLSVCVGDDGLSLCEEFGFGFGGGLEVNPFGSVADAGNDLIGEIGVGCGPLSLGAEASLNHCGDFTASAKGKLGGLGPTLSLDSEGNVTFGATAKGGGAQASVNSSGSTNLGLDVEGANELEGFKGKCKLGGKLAGQFCQSTR